MIKSFFKSLISSSYIFCLSFFSFLTEILYFSKIEFISSKETTSFKYFTFKMSSSSFTKTVSFSFNSEIIFSISSTLILLFSIFTSSLFGFYPSLFITPISPSTFAPSSTDTVTVLLIRFTETSSTILSFDSPFSTFIEQA